VPGSGGASGPVPYIKTPNREVRGAVNFGLHNDALPGLALLVYIVDIMSG
jgi:hypothetical protein